ncbi:MAG: glycosyltransferase family 39 protein [bacterium]|nr:glycosyltransferase family 39 protein [bacterium]
MEENKNIFYLAWAGLAFTAVIFFFFGLGQHALIDYDEATYAQVARECLSEGDCRSFTYLGNDWFEKPPLYFWLAAGSIKVFGSNEFAQRLPSALLGLLTVTLVGLLAYELTRNKWVGLAAAAILLLSGEFVFAARQFRMDVPVTFGLLLSVYSFVRGWRDSRWYLGVGLGIGLGVMFKSAIGFLALPLIFIFALSGRRWDWLTSAYFWLSGLLALALILPWHIYESARFGLEFWNSYFGLHILERFKRPVIGQGITVFHYLKYLFYLVQPWILIFMAGLVWLIFKFRLNIRRYPPVLAASAGSVFFIFIIFSIARTKLFYYLEPMYPLMAIFIAAAGLLIFQSLKTGQAERRLLIFFGALLLVGLINTGWQVFQVRDGFSAEFIVADEERKIGLYLADQAERKNIFAYGWNYFETLRYYGGGQKIMPIDRLDYAAAPFFLVMPTGLAGYYQADKEFRQRAEEIFSEKNLSLFEVR